MCRCTGKTTAQRKEDDSNGNSGTGGSGDGSNNVSVSTGSHSGSSFSYMSPASHAHFTARGLATANAVRITAAARRISIHTASGQLLRLRRRGICGLVDEWLCHVNNTVLHRGQGYRRLLARRLRELHWLGGYYTSHHEPRTDPRAASWE
jgi:hypothetical protein